MTATTITIGWTRSDMANGYSSFDGYRPGASQHTETITVDVPDDLDQCLVADACFTALNHPDPQSLCPLERSIWEAVQATGYRGQGAHYSLSVGDTVTVRAVNGSGDQTLACASFGWEIVR